MKLDKMETTLPIVHNTLEDLVKLINRQQNGERTQPNHSHCGVCKWGLGTTQWPKGYEVVINQEGGSTLKN